MQLKGFARDGGRRLLRRGLTTYNVIYSCKDQDLGLAGR